MSAFQNNFKKVYYHWPETVWALQLSSWWKQEHSESDKPSVIFSLTIIWIVGNYYHGKNEKDYILF